VFSQHRLASVIDAALIDELPDKLRETANLLIADNDAPAL
jgi:hypothetical protein